MKLFYFAFGFLLGAGSLLFLSLNFDLPFHDKHEHEHHHEHHDHDHDEENVAELSFEDSHKFGIGVEKAGPKQLSKLIVSRGRVTLPGNHLAHILPTASGVAVGSFKNIGDSVQEGEVIAILESQEMAELKAEYLAKLKKEELAFTSMLREKNLYDKQIVSENDYLLAALAFEEAKIAKELARQKLKAYNLTDEEIEAFASESNPNLRQFFIRSPLTGTIIHRHITLGEYLESTTPIFEIADLGLLWIETPVSLNDLNHIKTGEQVEVFFPYQKEPTLATIVRISPVLQEESLSAIAILALDNPNDAIKLGTFAKVHFEEEKESVPLALPCNAIQTIDGKACVFIRNESQFEKREVITGLSDGKHVEIISGLKPDDEVATGNTFILKADLGKHDAEHEH